ncbi:hypothetical protein K439DRAFT_1256837, partial [Ramaria rubella]
AGVFPALGVSGTFNRTNVQTPSAAAPCGNVPVNIDSSVAVPVNNGTVTLTAINFNGGTDGSRSFSAKISADGTTNNMVPAQVITNGDVSPTGPGSQPIVVQMPNGIQCTGGQTGNLCLLAMVSAGGFGNCAVVSQGLAQLGAIAARSPQADGTAGDSTDPTGDAT